MRHVYGLLMNCRYCQQPLNPCHDDKGLIQGECNPCQVQYYRDCINLICQIKDKEYCLQLREQHPQFPARIILNRKDVITNLTSIPNNLSPKTLVKKLKTILTFQ